MRFVLILFVLFPFYLSADIIIPQGWEDLVNNAQLNWLEKKVNEEVVKAVKTSKVSLTKLDDYLYLQITPNYVYVGDDSDERLAMDISDALGSISGDKDGVFMNLNWYELYTQKLPFNKKLPNAIKVVSSSNFYPSKGNLPIDVTFFFELNKLTGMVYSSLGTNKDFKLIYNSKKRFYKIKMEGIKTYFFVHIPNIVYEIAYAGNTFENIIGRKIKEFNIVYGVMKKYESIIDKNSKLSYDGRYIKGDNVFIDMWFFYDYVTQNKLNIDNLFTDILNGKPIKIKGSEKKKNG